MRVPAASVSPIDEHSQPIEQPLADNQGQIEELEPSFNWPSALLPAEPEWAPLMPLLPANWENFEKVNTDSFFL